MDNLKIWNEVKQPPPEALKTIQGGRLKGKTDINPQWRYKAMTEQFGACGVGWKYDVRVWAEPTIEDQTLAFAEVHLYIKVDGEWSDPIPGIGGSMLVTKESGGLHATDEGYKMAITDALSVAMKMLGVGANIYAGLSDSEYSNKPEPATATAPSKAEATTSEEPVEGLDMDWLSESLKKIKWTEKTTATWLTSHFGIEGGLLKDVLPRLTKEQLAEFAKEIQDRLDMA